MSYYNLLLPLLTSIVMNIITTINLINRIHTINLINIITTTNLIKPAGGAKAKHMTFSYSAFFLNKTLKTDPTAAPKLWPTITTLKSCTVIHVDFLEKQIYSGNGIPNT